MVERRLIWLAGIVLVWGGAILVKLVSLQVVHHQDYVRKARARQEETVPLRAQRGAILDRTGHPLALSVPTESFAFPLVKLYRWTSPNCAQAVEHVSAKAAQNKIRFLITYSQLLVVSGQTNRLAH